jgi:hypothetical protein
MVDLKKYHDRLQNKIGEAMSADKILEGPWWEVVIKDLNLMSYYCARDIALETKGSCDKNHLDGTLAYKLPYEEWPPMRLMALTLLVVLPTKIDSAYGRVIKSLSIPAYIYR